MEDDVFDCVFFRRMFLTDEELTDEGLDPNGVLYRACRDYQNTVKAVKSGAKPGTKDAERYVEQHIASGNTYPSRFISTTTSSEVALKYAEKPNYKSMIKIYLSRMTGMKALDEMINLTNTEVREHFIKGATHRNYAKSSKEVLFQWRIPKKNASGENVFELWTKGESG